VLCILFLIPVTTLLAEPQNVAKQKKVISSLRVNPLIYDRTVTSGMDEVYKNIFTALENNSYFVLFEPNIGKNLSHFAKRWGDDYNKNKLTSIRSMVFCNAWYANKISNIAKIKKHIFCLYVREKLLVQVKLKKLQKNLKMMLYVQLKLQ